MSQAHAGSIEETLATTLRRLEEARGELLQAIDGVPPQKLAGTVFSAWSVKDLLAHIALWNEMEVADMRRAARGDIPALDRFDYGFIEQLNDAQFQLRRKFPFEQVKRELHEAHQAILQFVAGAPGRLLAGGYIPIACIHAMRHDLRHAADVRQWREREGL